MPETPPSPGIDVTKPNIARVYDYWLGGKDNFAADRLLGEQLLALDPGMRDLVRGNRQFLCAATARAAREGGIRQFLDLGAGLPASPAVHEAAREVVPGARFAYVDNDPVVALHTRALLAGTVGLEPVLADLGDPRAVLSDPGTVSVLDLSQPAGIIMGSVGHFLPAERVRELTAAYLSRVPSGSWLIMSVGRAEDDKPEQKIKPAYTAAQTYRHSPEDFASFFAGTDVVPPGLVAARAWVAGVSERTPPAGLFMHCGAGVKR